MHRGCYKVKCSKLHVVAAGWSVRPSLPPKAQVMLTSGAEQLGLRVCADRPVQRKSSCCKCHSASKICKENGDFFPSVGWGPPSRDGGGGAQRRLPPQSPQLRVARMRLVTGAAAGCWGHPGAWTCTHTAWGPRPCILTSPLVIPMLQILRTWWACCLT